MFSPRWSKVIRDLLSHKGRTLLVVLAIAVGVFSFGSVFITQDAMLANMAQEYRSSRAASIFIYLDNFDESLLHWTETQPGIKTVAAAAAQTAKLILPDGKEEIINLMAVKDFNSMKLNLLVSKTGTWPPQKQEVVLERASLAASKAGIGDKLMIEASSQKRFDLLLAGTVYDNSAIPYTFMNQLTGYISWDTLGFLGYPKRFNQLLIATDDSIKTLADAEKMTFDLTENLKSRGVKINGTRVDKPNQHWAKDNASAFTAILSVIGVFSVILSGFLVVNTISALLAQQKKQIGIMKAIGGENWQITQLYLAMVTIYGLLALLIALPVGMGLGWVFFKMVADFMNLDIVSFSLPLSVFLMEVAAALVVPLVAALVPIIQGSKTSVRLALTDFQTVRQVGLSEHWLAKIRGLSRPMLLSLRNTFRKKGRLALTLGTLIIAGALFMSVVNTRSAMVLELERILQMFDFSVDVVLDKDYEVAGLESRVKEVAKVTAVESRTGVSARRIKADGSKGSGFSISGLPPETPFSHPIMLSGRWLRVGDQNQIVLSSSYIRDNSDLSVGDDLYVSINNDKKHFEIVGIVAMAGDQKLGFMDFKQVAQIKDAPGVASSIMVKTEPNDGKTQDEVATAIEDRLKRANVKVTAKQTKDQIFSSAANQFDFMVGFLLAMAVMVAIVGGLGLAGTMSLNVLERTREIGIMRSIGANNQSILKLVMTEGVLIGLISWVAAVPLSLPMTYGFGYAIGNAFFSRTLVFTFVPVGTVIWLGIVLAIAALASLLPARRASKMSISETLAYE